ncbi:MAG: glycosyltransferase family 4 protein [bacterium]|nr:glycosyltransferase family 4 protein [bacterium]
MSERRSDRDRRVCFVRHNYFPAELSVRREAETLVRNGYDVSMICLRGEDEKSFEMVDGVSIHRMPVGHKRGRILRYLFEYNAFFVLASVKLLWMHLRRPFGFIQVNTMPDYLVFVATIPKLLGARVVLHMHEPMPELYGTMFPKPYHAPIISLIKLSEKLSLKFANHALTVTREMRENFGRRGADINNITVIVNVPDEKRFRKKVYWERIDELAEQKRERRRQGIFKVITHGAIEFRYGQDTIVESLSRVRERVPGIEFRLLGNGAYLDNVLALARELKVDDRVKYLGYVSFDEMINELLFADVGVVPMKSNPYSNLVHTNKMYEFIALCRPVIATRLSSVSSYFPDDSVVYYEPGNADDLADKFYSVFAHPEEVESRVKKATEIYETYRWDRESKKYLGVYQGLTGRSRQETAST